MLAPLVVPRARTRTVLDPPLLLPPELLLLELLLELLLLLPTVTLALPLLFHPSIATTW